jgi:hypothetical protein
MEYMIVLLISQTIAMCIVGFGLIKSKNKTICELEESLVNLTLEINGLQSDYDRLRKVVIEEKKDLKRLTNIILNK